MLHKPHTFVSVLAAAMIAGAFYSEVVRGAKPAAPSPGRAVFLEVDGAAIYGDEQGSYLGTFDRDGNFSFDTGSQRAVNFTFGDALALFGGAPTGSTFPPNGPTNAVRFQTLVSAGTGGLGTVTIGASGVRSVKFTLPGDAVSKITSFTLDFRGNALLDDNGDGVANGACNPNTSSTACLEDGTEMSKMWVVCTENALDGKCARWTLTPCDGACGDVNADPDFPASTPVAQLFGSFKAPVGNSRIARFAMPWGLEICRVTAGITCQ